MRRLWRVMFTLIIILGVVCSYKKDSIAASTNKNLTLSVIPSAKMVERGEEFTVKVNIDEGANLSAVNYEIHYDQSQVQFKEYLPGDVFTAWENANQPDFFSSKSSGFVKAVNSDIAGVVKVGAAGVNGTNEAGEFGVFKFKVKDTETNNSVAITLDVTSACQASHGLAEEGNGITILPPITTEVNVITDLSGYSVIVNGTNVYTGNPVTPSVIVKNGSTTLVEETDYDVSYDNNVNAGTGKAIITGKGAYTGKITKTFTISKADQTVEASVPTTNLKVGKNTNITSACIGTVSYSSDNEDIVMVSASGKVVAIAKGTATITITASGDTNHKAGTKDITVIVTEEELPEKISLDDCEVTVEPGAFTYDGSEKTPKVTIKNGNTALLKDVDYIVYYSNNINAGTAKVVISGKGRYEGTVENNFTIKKASQTVAAVISKETIEKGKTAQITVNGIGSISYEAIDDDIIMVNPSGKVSAFAKGTTEIIITAKGDENYESASTKIAVTVIEEDRECVHDWGKGVVTKQPTCSEKGERTYTCSKCSQTKVKKIKANGHYYSSSYTVDKAATCTNEGRKSRHCTVCGEKTDIRTIPAIGHKYVLTINGNIKTYNCPICGDHHSETLSVDNTEYVENALISKTNDKDLKGTTFNKLTARLKKATNSSISVQWKKVNGASNYYVYAVKCNSGGTVCNLSKVYTASAGSTSYTYSGLVKGTYYKFVIMAVCGNKVLATSKTLFITTTGGKYTNIKTLLLDKKKIVIKKGQTFTDKVKKVTLQSKKLKIFKYRANTYESSNSKIATVSSKGRIKGIRKGTCTIYVYAQNGIYRSLKVTVK